MDDCMSRRVVLLLGAGHAHLHVAQHAHAFVKAGARLILVDPGKLWYSGMATGLLAGQYEPADDQIDPRPVIEQAGGEFLSKQARRLRPSECVVDFEDGSSQAYDFLSLNVGSEVAHPFGEGDNLWPVKPISNLSRLRAVIERVIAAEGRFPRICVVGGGPTGCEVAACLAGLARRRRVPARLTLLSSRRRLIDPYSAAAGEFMRAALAERGVTVELDAAITGRDQRALLGSDGRRFDFDHAVIATGLRPTALVRDSGLPCDAKDGIRVDAMLRSQADSRVFAAGDCASFTPRKLPKIGVFGVRAAPTLLHNLLASLAAARCQPFRPQRRYLSLMNLGDDEALATWGPLWLHGKLPLRFKDKIDRRFMERYRGPGF